MGGFVRQPTISGSIGNLPPAEAERLRWKKGTHHSKWRLDLTAKSFDKPRSLQCLLIKLDSRISIALNLHCLIGCQHDREGGVSSVKELLNQQNITFSSGEALS